jgi:hypothetical protein
MIMNFLSGRVTSVSGNFPQKVTYLYHFCVPRVWNYAVAAIGGGMPWSGYQTPFMETEMPLSNLTIVQWHRSIPYHRLSHRSEDIKWCLEIRTRLILP